MKIETFLDRQPVTDCRFDARYWRTEGQRGQTYYNFDVVIFGRNIVVSLTFN